MMRRLSGRVANRAVSCGRCGNGALNKSARARNKSVGAVAAMQTAKDSVDGLRRASQTVHYYDG
jgi:hypothetical protein